MRVKQVLVPLLLILILVMFNRVFFNTFSKANQYFSTQVYSSSENTHPQKLFEKTWRIIYKDYYDSSLNHQDWGRWKTHYHNKIKTIDDAINEAVLEVKTNKEMNIEEK